MAGQMNGNWVSGSHSSSYSNVWHYIFLYIRTAWVDQSIDPMEKILNFQIVFLAPDCRRTIAIMPPCSVTAVQTLWYLAQVLRHWNWDIFISCVAAQGGKERVRFISILHLVYGHSINILLECQLNDQKKVKPCRSHLIILIIRVMEFPIQSL